MVDCGFNSFELAEGQDADKCLAALDGFTQNYQSTVGRPEPAAVSFSAPMTSSREKSHKTLLC